MASSNQLLINSLTQLFYSVGPLVGAAKQQHPRLQCLLLIHRPLLSTILSALAAGCEGLCGDEPLGRVGLLEVLLPMEIEGIHLDPLISGMLQRIQKGRTRN